LEAWCNSHKDWEKCWQVHSDPALFSGNCDFISENCIQWSDVFFYAASHECFDMCTWLLAAHFSWVTNVRTFRVPNDNDRIMTGAVLKHDPAAACQALLCAGYNLSDNAAWMYGYVNSVLEWAAKTGSMRVLQFLHHEDVMPTIRQLQTCLKLAASQGHVEALKFLRAWRQDLTVAAIEDSLALTSAAGNGHLDALRFMFEAWGFTVATLRKDPWIFANAARNGHLDILMFFRDLGQPQAASPGLRAGDCVPNRLTLQDVRASGNDALFQAAINGHVHVVQFFKETYGMTLDDVRVRNNVIFRMTAINGHVQVLQYLRDWRDSANPADRLTLKDVRSNNNNALREAAQSGHLEVLQFLQSWVDPDGDRLTLADVRTDNNYALIWSAARGHLHVLMFLRAWRDADGSALTKADVCTNHNMALQQAAINDRFEVCQFLAEWAREHSPRPQDLELVSRAGP